MRQCIVLVLAIAAATAWGVELTDAPVFEIPMLRGITVDGNPADWGERGFRVEMMADQLQRVQPFDNLAPRFRLGWDDDGLLLLVQVADNVWVEQEQEISIWDGDSLEIFIVKERGTSKMMQVVVGPGVTPGQPELRTRLLGPQLSGAPEGASIEAARTFDEQGYVFEMRFPWKNLDITPERGLEMGFQIFVNDVDAPPARFQAVWYPLTRTHERSERSHRIVLARRPSPPVRAIAVGEYDEWAQTRVRVRALAEFAGQEARVLDGREALAKAVLRPLGPDHAGADLSFPIPPAGKTFGPLDVVAGDEHVTTLYLPDADAQRAKLLLVTPIELNQYVFAANAPPSGGFRSPLLAESLLKGHETTVTWYDAAGRQVASTEAVGRYGAVIEVRPESGPVLRRYRTAFRAPAAFAGVNWWDYRPDAALSLPEDLMFAPEAVETHQPSLTHFLKRSFEQALQDNMDSAVLLAALHEHQGGAIETTRANDAWALDRQWWVEHKRRMNGMAEAYSSPFACPHPVEGTPAPALREGAEAEAGMTPGAVAAIDAACQAWWDASGEPFAVAVARDGVVFFHKAYGTRNGKPMTTETPSWMASITKLLSGTLMMTLVDQGLVSLDADIAEYLPELRGIEVDTPLTIRRLYTHTNGLLLGVRPPDSYQDHWGDEYHDLEHIIAEYYPHLEVGKTHGYNGVGYALAGKIIESVTGKAIPQFFMDHLLAPLGCEHTEAIDTSARAYSVPMDIARIGQMLLNRGRYGDMQFFSAETFEMMMPQDISHLLEAETDLKWGIGPVFMPEAGFGPGTFGHGAASGATLRIDPENRLVVVVTRNTLGKDYWVHHPEFIRAIAEHLPGADAP